MQHHPSTLEVELDSGSQKGASTDSDISNTKVTLAAELAINM